MSEELEQKINDLIAENQNLKNENNSLKNQMTQNQSGIHGLLAQLDAHKQKINEDSQVSLNIRTNCILLGKSNKELVDANEVLKKRVCELEAKS